VPEFTIERVKEENFPYFLYLLNLLTGYEYLDPPTEGARLRLKADNFGKSRKVRHISGS
jgi:hypothetical protein